MKNLSHSLPIALALMGLLAAFVAATPASAGAEIAAAADPREHGAGRVAPEKAANRTADVRTWNAPAQAVALRVIDKYGQPDESGPDRLVWHHRGPWTRIVARREPAQGNFAPEHPDYLEQTVAYDVPLDRLADVEAFEPSLLVDVAQAELTARSDTEETNILALNVADDVVAGRKPVQEAKAFYSRTSGLAVSGKSSKYTQGLLFRPKDQTASP